jgi:hypothetical protein
MRKIIKALRRIWILGAGKFGRIAAEALEEKARDGLVTVVDTDPERLIQMAGLPLLRIQEDGLVFLERCLTPTGAPDWIIPVIPVHVAAEWIAARLAKRHEVRRLAVPAAAVKRLPNPLSGAGGDLYTSLADFVCPEDCPQPASHCTYTGKPRPYNLYDRLASLRPDGFRTIVIISRQLAPGVGGLDPQDLFQALKTAQAERTPFLLSTACRCHGVVSAFGFRN